VIRRKNNLFLAAGSFALAIGLGLRFWTHGNYANFASDFFLGVSLALLIFGTWRRSRAVSR
jgi:hypothetical protein